MRELYKFIESKINSLDFSKLWPDFEPFPFALYNQEQIFLKDKTIPWNEAFIGNTSIQYNGETLAIWNVTSPKITDESIAVLASKIVHEMFHAFQQSQNEKRFPDERVAILKYRYDPINLTIRYQENEILFRLYANFEINLFFDFLQRRYYRKSTFPFEFDYESKIEAIEGMAQYCEMKALRFFDENLFQTEVQKIMNRIKEKHYLFPIRKQCYDTGCLLLLIADENNLNFRHTIDNEKTMLTDLIASQILPFPKRSFDIFDEEIKNGIDQFLVENETLIKNTENRCNNTLTDSFMLAGFDPYNARIFESKIYCPNFFALIDDNQNPIVFPYTAIIDVGDSLKTKSILYIK